MALKVQELLGRGACITMLNCCNTSAIILQLFKKFIKRTIVIKE